MRWTTLAFVALAGCAGSNAPAHPLAGTWEGEKTLVLSPSTYRLGEELGVWSADTRTFRFKEDPAQTTVRKAEERCTYSLTGRNLVLAGCRFAGRYMRAG